eukprot:scaffold419543_cov38-Prasinocladus_malaysianus.AAC.1
MDWLRDTASACVSAIASSGTFRMCFPVAVKRIWTVTPEQMRAAQQEVDVIKRMNHPSLLQLIDHAVVQRSDDQGVTGSDVFILFPLFEEGSLMDEMDRRICKGIAAMHSSSPALSHRDIKPQNILLSRRQGVGSSARYTVAVTDFGSARPAVLEVTNRKEAIKAQVLSNHVIGGISWIKSARQPSHNDQ